MKGVFVIIDGVSDEPCSVLNNLTPLQAAKTPNLDILAKKSKINHCYTVKKGFTPSSDEAILSLLGYDYPLDTRGPFEVLGLGMNQKKGDLAFRCNFATIDSLEKSNIIDRRAGRTLTTKEAKILAKEVNNQVKLKFPFEFKSGIQHRGALLIKGNFSDNITNIDRENEKIAFSKTLDKKSSSKLSAETINNFAQQSFEVLNKHPINLARIKKGLYPANFIICRGVGNSPPKLKKLKGRWIALGYYPLEIGIAKAAGMSTYEFVYPKMKDIDVYKNLYQGLDKAIRHSIKMLKKKKEKYDYFYIHFKEPDVPGHDNKPLEKIKMIEILDKKFFSFLKDFIKDSKLIITADHTTSCRKKAHSSTPVPVLIYPDKKDRKKRFTEEEGMKGKSWLGKKLLAGNL